MVYESAEIPVDALLANVLRKYAAQISGVPQEPFGTVYSTDVRNFINDAKIQAVTFGPGDVRQAHIFDESIEIKQIVECIKILFLTIIELL